MVEDLKLGILAVMRSIVINAFLVKTCLNKNLKLIDYQHLL